MKDKDRCLLWISRKAAELSEWPQDLRLEDAKGVMHVIDSGRDDLLRQLKQFEAGVQTS